MDDKLGVLLLLFGEASGVFPGSPFFFEHDADKLSLERVRWGEAVGAAIVVGTGAVLSASRKDKMPLIAALLITAAFVGGYEYKISNPSNRPDNSASDDASAPLGKLSGFNYGAA